MVNGYKQFTWRKVAHRSDERLDCLVYALAALVHARVNLEKLSGPLVETEAKEKQQPEGAKRPTWGVMPGNGLLLPDGMTVGPKVAPGSVPVPQNKSRSPWGVQNRPIEW